MTSKNFAIIKPVRQRSAQGRRLVVTTPDGRRKTTDSIPKSTFIFTIRRKVDGLLNSGLDYYIDNPYKADKAEDANFPTNWRNSDIWKDHRITKQTELEIKWNLPPNQLTNKPNLRSGFKNKGQEPTYLESFKYLLENAENRISLETLKGEIMIEACKASSLVANSESEVISSPYARFYLAEINEDEKRRAKKSKEISKALSNLLTLSEKYPVLDMKKIAVLTRVASTVDKLSEEALFSKLSDFINDNSRGSANIEEFQKYYGMITSKGSKKTLDTKYFVRELVSYNVLSEIKGAFYWNSKGRDTSLYELARTEEALVQWLLDKGNEPFYKELEQELSIKKNL